MNDPNRSSHTVRLSVLILACVAATLVSCTPKDPGALARPVNDGLDTLTVDSTSMAADGASLTRIVAHIPAVDSLDQRIVTFATTFGSFATTATGSSGGTLLTVNADQGRHAYVWLRAPRASGTAFVTASVGSTTFQRQVAFLTALPEVLLIAPSRFTLKAGLDSTITISASLRRAVGLSTPGAVVTFAAARSTGDSVGRFFIPTLSDDNGVVTVRLAASASDTGVVTITARTAGASGKLLTAQTTINVIP